MKKAIKVIGLCCLATIFIVGIYLSIQPKTLDFRGTVTEIETMNNETIFHISIPSIGASFIVVADNKTEVRPCHKDHPAIDLANIKVGDIIDGDYRGSSNDYKAKFITVWYHN